jgi:hypothetical protein
MIYIKSKADICLLVWALEVTTYACG